MGPSMTETLDSASNVDVGKNVLLRYLNVLLQSKQNYNFSQLFFLKMNGIFCQESFDGPLPSPTRKCALFWDG